MFPQFQRIVTLSVMSILVGLFAWIYQRDRQPRARLWMIGWAAIVAHFAGMLLVSFGLIPARLADWSAYSTLVAAGSAFFLSVCQTRGARLGRWLFWAGIVAPAIAYWTCMIFEVQSPLVYRAAGGNALRGSIDGGAPIAAIEREPGNLVRGSHRARYLGRLARIQPRRVRHGFPALRRLRHHRLALLEILPALDSRRLAHRAGLSGLGPGLPGG